MGVFVLGLAMAGVACVLTGVTWLEVRRQSAATAAPDEEQHDRGLGDRMNSMARRFAGLWFAGRSGNRELAEYELYEMREEIEGIEAMQLVEHGVDVSVMLKALADNQLESVDRSLEAGGDAFEDAYRTTVSGCNACHVASQHSFIRISVPTAPPVTNRIYEPVISARPGGR